MLLRTIPWVYHSIKKLPKSDKVLPYVFVADDAFGLRRHMMKPYPSTNLPTQKLVFNYRLSRARRIIENTFGIAASRFRIFYKPILAGVNKVKHITKAVVVLHNFLMTENHTNDNYDYCPAAFVDNEGPNGMWRSEVTKGLLPLNRSNSSNNFSRNAKEIRDSFMDYFNNEGAVDWQLERVNRC